jgi:hypothetical protein
MEKTMTRPEELYGLQGAYLDAYNAIVKPHQIFPVKLYTLRRWTPILGASGFWLLVALQQACFKNPHSQDWCIISKPRLAEESALSEPTVHRYLRDDDYEQFQLTRWVRVPTPEVVNTRRRWSASAGRMVQAPNRYQVLLDPPLTQQDQRGLAYLLLTRRRDGLAQLVEQFQAMNFNKRLKLLSKAVAEAGDWDGWTPTPKAIAESIWNNLHKVDLEILNSLYQSLQGPVKLFPQYFRQHWLPRLGPKRALVYIQLRSRCFLSTEEKRDQVEIAFTALAHESGCSAPWLRKATGGEFYAVHRQGRGRSPVFTVQLRVPLVPEHQDRYEKMLGGQYPNERGQWMLPSETEENGSSEHLKNDSSEMLGSENGSSEMLGHQRTVPVKCSDDENDSGEMLGRRRTVLVKCIINTYVINTSKDYITLERQQHDNTAAVVRALFDAFGITGHPRLREQYEQSFAVVQAWMLYAPTCSLENPQGFVVAKLRVGEPPPARFLQYARLKPDQWQSAWRAGHYGGAYGDADIPIDADAWWSDFADVFENGPFGRGRVTAAQIEAVLADTGHPDASARVSRDRIMVTGISRQDAEVIREALEAEGVRHRVVAETSPALQAGKAGEGASWPVWEHVLNDLGGQMTQATFDAHLARSVGRRQNGRVTVYVSNAYTVDWVEARLRPQIERTVRRLSGEDLEIQFAVCEEPVE